MYMSMCTYNHIFLSGGKCDMFNFQTRVSSAVVGKLGSLCYRHSSGYTSRSRSVSFVFYGYYEHCVINWIFKKHLIWVDRSLCILLLYFAMFKLIKNTFFFTCILHKDCLRVLPFALTWPGLSLHWMLL